MATYWQGDGGDTMSRRQQLRQEAREQAKQNKLPTVRAYPKDVVHAMKQQQKKAMRLQMLVNRLWRPDDWDLD